MNEPLYIVIFRGSDAQKHLLSWAKQHGLDQRHVDKKRLNLYNQNMLDKFRMTWTQTWSAVTIWDCWNKRHLEVH